MKLVAVAKILKEALCTSWNFSSAYWLHYTIDVEKSDLILNIYVAQLKYTSIDISTPTFIIVIVIIES